MRRRSDPRRARRTTSLAMAASTAILISQTSYGAAAGRPIISGGTIKTANGQLLRGCHAHIRSANNAITKYFTDINNVIKLRDQAHMNVIRIAFLVPDWGGASTFEQGIPIADAIVANCEAAGIYAIINYHGPMHYDGGVWDVRKFWDALAPRYKDKTFVLYGVLNENTQGAPPTGGANTWPTDQLVDLYKNHIRNYAPNTMIMGHNEPVNITANWGPYNRDVFGPAAGIDWNAGKDAFSFHAYGGTAANITATRGVVPTVLSEFSFSGEGWTQLQLGGYSMPSEWCERNGMSWMVWQQWQSGETDQLKSVMAYLIPDAISKGYAWWNAVGTAPASPARAVTTPAARTLVVQANGRVVGRSIGKLAQYRLVLTVSK